MANPLLLLVTFSFIFLPHSNQLPNFQSHSLLLIQNLLNYPPELSSFNRSTTDFCNIDPSPSLTLVCYEGNLTQLHITGNLRRLPPNFSAQSLFAALASPNSTLKVLSLVSLGLYGPLPSEIGQLTSLEILNVSSNYFSGAIPPSISSLKNLQTLVLDSNSFTDNVPGWLSSLPELAVLSLSQNSLTGSLPKSMKNMINLRVLSIAKNCLSGEVPHLHSLTNLQVLDLEDNFLGPNFPTLHNKLVVLSLKNNSFGFGIPDELLSFYQLQKLDISLNGFVGPFLPSILSLPSLNYLDISQNKFTGMLSSNVSCNADLSHVDFSSNLLSGDLPTCLELNSKTNVVRFSSNCLSNREQKQHPPSFCNNQALAVKVLPPDKAKHNKVNGHAVLASSTIGGAAVVSLVFLLIRRAYRKEDVEKPQKRLIMERVSSVNTMKLLSDARYVSQTMKLGASLPPYRTFSLEELKEATDNFDASNLLDEDSHCKIFSGNFADGTLVAVRSLAVRKKHNQQTITKYIELVSKLRHGHLTSALGHCFEYCSLDDSCIINLYLVFEFVPNGTLRDYTSGVTGKEMISWGQRIRAAIGVAKGVQFLQTGTVPGLFSNNLKITDVLLDHDLHVKICCYNLPIITENRALVSAAASSFPGTEQNLQETSGVGAEDKRDVYDIGEILLEIIAGTQVMSQNKVSVLKDLLQESTKGDDLARTRIVDSSINKECSDESMKVVMEICHRCLSNEASVRPSVEDVIWNLQFAAQLQDSWKGESNNNQDSVVSQV